MDRSVSEMGLLEDPSSSESSAPVPPSAPPPALPPALPSSAQALVQLQPQGLGYALYPAQSVGPGPGVIAAAPGPMYDPLSVASGVNPSNGLLLDPQLSQ
jgi:hypothetical protein